MAQAQLVAIPIGVNAAVAIPIDMNAVAHPVVNAEPPKKRRKRQHHHALLPKRPKRSVNAYSMFLKDFFRQRGPGANRTTMVEASQNWKSLTVEQKAEYELACVEDKERYVSEMTLWKQQRAFVKRPASAYALFLKDTWETEKANGTVGDKGVGDMGRLAAERWRAMAPAEKDVYKTRYVDQVNERTGRLSDLAHGNVVSTANGLEVRAPDAGQDQLNQPAAVVAADPISDEEGEDSGEE